LLAIAIVTMVLLIFDVVSGIVPGVAAAVAAALLLAGMGGAPVDGARAGGRARRQRA
jgi:hypothetical protein